MASSTEKNEKYAPNRTSLNATALNAILTNIANQDETDKVDHSKR